MGKASLYRSGEPIVTVNLYSFVDLYDRALATAAHLLDKGAAHADAQGVGEAEMLAWRLIDDMHPLSFQLMVVVNFARQWPARVAGLPEPSAIGADLGVLQFKAAIADARRDLAALTPAQFEGRDEVPLSFRIAEQMEPTLPAGQWLSVFATTNLYFHLSTAYGILRAHGAPIGKPDLFARGL
jgi:hypothetical protein